ncbi:Signal transduction response regulator, receiver domain protein [Kalmanozyma brasiliensis GHG001]|uniref:Signal transduction response regulator, receiver domain protein n=1 Tax=Kalmanozyma brasiliensis (strain GHG001) TaxID=1365824 RepID=UPI002867CF7D|nr:Signal transduction response regulator, receiver domain protein [Kalmanozyma brasiliensis GHG001]EST09862.2 Signal transduction response regulator, receiver domain protein [Kalmanozyma brasiliensis GHG001]
MSSESNANDPLAQASTSSSAPNGNATSSLEFTESDSNDPASALQRPRSPSKSAFQWPSEPLNNGRPSLPQDSQQSVDDANRDISQRITDAGHDATSGHSKPYPGLDRPRRSAQLTANLDSIEDDRRQQLSPTSTSFDPTSASSLPVLSPQVQNMDRTSSHGTNGSAASDGPDAPSSKPHYPNYLPDMLRNAATIPIDLLRSLVPDNAFPSNTDEGLSASTLQVPVTSFNALFEACKLFEWLANQASQLETLDRGHGSRRPSTTQQQSDDGVDFTYFDYLETLQKVADVVSGLAAARGIDLVLDLEPQLHGEPADNQRHYKLGSCTVWADRIALTFLFMSCISRLLRNSPVRSTVVVTTTLTPQEENVVRPDSGSEMKLVILSLGLRLVLPRTVAATQELMSSISGTPASLLLDAFGAGLTTEQSVSQLPGGPDRAVIDHSITIPVGQLAEPQELESTQHQGSDSKHRIGPDQDELADFASTLQGKRVALYSTSRSFFARQVATFLSGVGCDVAPVFTDNVDESSFDGSDRIFGKHTHTAVALTSGRPTLVSYTSDIDRQVHPASSPPSSDTTAPTEQSKQDTMQPSSAVDTAVLDPVTGVPVTFDNSDHVPPTVDQIASPQAGADDKMLSPETQIDSTGRKVVPFSFVIIDDDIVTLQKELLRIRSAVPILKSALASKASPHNPPANERRLPRPTLDHRTKSSPQVNRIMASQLGNASTRSFGSLGTELMNGENGNKNVDSMDESVSQTIIFFTSMKSYRLVRDTVQPIIDSASFRGVASPPEIMVLPKPAGPRRILTALHVAQHKPLVRLPFLPIATSPLSPLITHSKTWWSSDSSQQQDGQGFMTLTRRETDSTFAEEDTTPSTPWSPIEAAHAPEGISTPEIPLTKENLPLAAAPAAKGASIRTVTQPTGADDAASSAAMTTKSAPRSSISRQTGNNTNADATPAPAPIPADASVAPKTNSGGSGAPSTTSPLSSSQLARSQAVSSPMPADALEYFSETAAKMGGSAASGMVIQSPDGRPAGIFFQPKSTPSVPGSKPGLSRGMSASSIRRGPSSETSERSDTAARDRRLMNRSVGSTGAGRRGSAADIHNLRPSDLPTLNEQGTPAGSAASTDSRPSQLSNVGKYPSGSMFAPQVGIHSVLNSSRPPMTTPLSSLASQAREADEDSAGAQDAAATQDVTQKSDSGKPADSSPQATDAGKPTGETSQPSKPTGPGSTKSAGSAAVGEGAAPGTNPAPAIASGSNSTTATPNARTAPNAAHRLANKAAPASATASPSDPRKPSAVPQSGFMMGMGFTSTKRRNQGPKKAPVREAVLPPIKVLIVEDNPINQRILSMFMGKKKIKYDVANNGREAVEKWKTGGYHLILMDIQLPVMDGIEATKEIRKLERSANIGILPNTPEAVAEGGGSRTVTAKGVKGQVASPSTKPASGSGGPGAKGALVNGVGEANRTRPASSGSINPFRASVIIVALTASVLSSDRVEALAAGCNDFLNKPVSLPWLNQKILEWGSMMYLMYSGLSSDDIHLGDTHATANSGAAGGRVDRAQLHLGFGYGPAEKAKALANNLHLGDTLAAKKKKRAEANQAQSEANKEQREANMEQREANVEKKEGQQEQQKQAKEQPSTASEEAPAEKSAEEVVGKDKDEDKDGNEKDKHEEKDEAAG